MAITNSLELYEKATERIPGGVNSPVRACQSVCAAPVFISYGQGSHVFDVDGNGYIDYVCSWGPLILGHAWPESVQAVQMAAARGLSFGAPTGAETELAELVYKAFPGMEMLRLVSSGTEAAMSAVRLARGVTGRELVVKFDGCYHGHADTFLFRPGSGLATPALSGHDGIPAAVVQNTVSLAYNDINAVDDFMQRHGKNTACIIVEPVAGNMGLVLPEEGFLAGLRQICTHYDALLIFDEVITGFRVAYGGAQEHFGVQADLTVLGEILGGGMPMGAYGGKRAYMEKLVPLGPVYQAGTLSGNPVATACGLATLKALTLDVYTYLEQLTALLMTSLQEAAATAGVAVETTRIGSLGGLFFNANPVYDYVTAQTSNAEA